MRVEIARPPAAARTLCWRCHHFLCNVWQNLIVWSHHFKSPDLRSADSFVRLWYGESKAASNAIGRAKHRSPSDGLVNHVKRSILALSAQAKRATSSLRPATALLGPEGASTRSHCFFQPEGGTPRRLGHSKLNRSQRSP